MQHDQLLQLLAGSSSKKPIGFNELLSKSGLSKETLDSVLDDLYASRCINQAEVSRKDKKTLELIKQREVWLVGILTTFKYSSKPSERSAPKPVPRREEIKPTAKIEAEPIKKETIVSAEEVKPNTLQVLEFIEANPNCSSFLVSNAFDFKSPLSYIRLHINNGKVLKNEIKGTRSSTFKLAPGFTAASIYGSGPKKKVAENTEVEKLADAIVDVSKEASELDETYAIPAFLRKDVAGVDEDETPRRDVRDIELDAAKQEFLKHKILDEGDTLSFELEAETVHGELETTTRFAYTSESTLLIMNGKVVTEMDRTATKRLIEFLDSVCLIEANK